MILENIQRHREAGEAPKAAAIKGAGEVSTAIVASTMTTLSIFVPVIFIGGFAGIFFGQMAFVVSFALICALAVALTIVTILHMTVGEQGPKIWAISRAESMSLRVAYPLAAFTIVFRTAPSIEVPFIAAIVDLPEGTAVKANLGGVEPEGEKVAALLGKKLEMYTEAVRKDQEGNDVVVFRYRPAAS